MSLRAFYIALKTNQAIRENQREKTVHLLPLYIHIYILWFIFILFCFIFFFSIFPYIFTSLYPFAPSLCFVIILVVLLIVITPFSLHYITSFSTHPRVMQTRTMPKCVEAAYMYTQTRYCYQRLLCPFYPFNIITN